MKIISFDEMYGTNYNFSNLVAMYQQWGEGTVFQMTANPRPTSCLLLFVGCDALYTFSDKSTVQIQRGSAVYIPQGAKYKTQFLNCEKQTASTILVEFKLLCENGEQFAATDGVTELKDSVNPFTVKLYEDAVKAYTPSAISYAELKSALYKILANQSAMHHREVLLSGKFADISKGVLYMENNILTNIRISELAQLCHVSECHFRRLFKEYSGKTPIEYLTEAKIEYAKKLISNSSMNISKIAESLSFEDTAYFCRVFKKITGQTPGDFGKTN